MFRLTSAFTDRDPKNGEYFTIAIDGRGASGKSSLARFLGSLLPHYVVLPGDDYFEPHDDPVTWGEFNEVRQDADVLAKIRTGDRDIRVSAYDFPHGRIGAETALVVEQGLIFERCFAFSLNAPWDMRIWVDAPSEVCLQRGLRRDGAIVLGDRARLAWETVWQPREDRYIQEFAPVESADHIADGTAPFDAQFE